MFPDSSLQSFFWKVGNCSGWELQHSTPLLSRHQEADMAPLDCPCFTITGSDGPQHCCHGYQGRQCLCWLSHKSTKVCKILCSLLLHICLWHGYKDRWNWICRWVNLGENFLPWRDSWWPASYIESLKAKMHHWHCQTPQGCLALPAPQTFHMKLHHPEPLCPMLTPYLQSCQWRQFLGQYHCIHMCESLGYASQLLHTHHHPDPPEN